MVTFTPITKAVSIALLSANFFTMTSAYAEVNEFIPGETTAVNGETVSYNGAPDPIDDNWDATTKYAKGDDVNYNGEAYVAKWTQAGKEPSVTGAWKLVGIIVIPGAAWDTSAKYTKGDEVTYNGERYVAKWGQAGKNPSVTRAWELSGIIVIPGSAWNVAAKYSKNDEVTYNGGTYIAKWGQKGKEPGQNNAWKSIDVQFSNWSLSYNQNIICQDDLDACADLDVKAEDTLTLSIKDSAGMVIAIDLEHSGDRFDITGYIHAEQIVTENTSWKDNLPAAFGMQHDDWCGNVPSLLNHVVPELTNRGLTASIGIIASQCTTADWVNATNFVSGGFSLNNHSYSHPAPDWGTSTLTAAWNDQEQLQTANELIIGNTGYTPSMFAIPYGVWSKSTDDFIRAYEGMNKLRAPTFIDGSWVQSSGINGTNIPDTYSIKYNLYDNDWSTYNKGNAGAAKITAYLDDTIAAGGFGLQAFHGVNDASYSSVPLAEYQEAMDYIETKVSEKAVWVQTPETIIDYAVSRDACTQTSSVVPFGWLVKMDTSVADCQNFSTELTLSLINKGEVLEVIQNGERLSFTQVGYQVLVNYLPTAGDLLVVSKNFPE
jgi:chitodextrinase/peptidoglycan/xylan/chitin deacetylase (PgdA/CDA1 family)